MDEKEQKFFDDWFNEITETQDEQTKVLRQMNIAVQIIGVIVLLSAILAAYMRY